MFQKTFGFLFHQFFNHWKCDCHLRTTFPKRSIFSPHSFFFTASILSLIHISSIRLWTNPKQSRLLNFLSYRDSSKKFFNWKLTSGIFQKIFAALTEFNASDLMLSKSSDWRKLKFIPWLCVSTSLKLVGSGHLPRNSYSCIRIYLESGESCNEMALYIGL